MSSSFFKKKLNPVKSRNMTEEGDMAGINGAVKLLEECNEPFLCSRISESSEFNKFNETFGKAHLKLSRSAQSASRKKFSDVNKDEMNDLCQRICHVSGLLQSLDVVQNDRSVKFVSDVHNQSYNDLVYTGRFMAGQSHKVSDIASGVERNYFLNLKSPVFSGFSHMTKNDAVESEQSSANCSTSKNDNLDLSPSSKMEDSYYLSLLNAVTAKQFPESMLNDEILAKFNLLSLQSKSNSGNERYLSAPNTFNQSKVNPVMSEVNMDLTKGKGLLKDLQFNQAQVHGPPGANVFIFHIPNKWTERDLYDNFSVFGNILSVRIATDETCRNRGFGFVSYTNIYSALISVSSMNGYQTGGKRLKVQIKKGEERYVIATILSSAALKSDNSGEATLQQNMELFRDRDRMISLLNDLLYPHCSKKPFFNLLK